MNAFLLLAVHRHCGAAWLNATHILFIPRKWGFHTSV